MLRLAAVGTRGRRSPRCSAPSRGGKPRFLTRLFREKTVSPPGPKAGRRLLAVTAAVSALVTIAACSGGTTAGGAASNAATTASAPAAGAAHAATSAATAVGGVPQPRSGSACDVLTEQVAEELLGQPTTVEDSESADAGSDCRRDGTRDPDDQIEYGWQKPKTPGYESPDQRASGCQGTVSRPAGFGADAVLCRYRPEPLESDWLGWTVDGVLYIVVVQADDQELPADVALHAADLLTS